MTTMLKRSALGLILMCGFAGLTTRYSGAQGLCGNTYNNVGPGDDIHCYYDENCEGHGESTVCEENDCSDCLGNETGESSFCVPEYDCGSIRGCSYVICT